MMRSMYSAVSGLKNHQTRMDVIGNNIANVNTTGFKKSRVVFKDSLYQSLRGASRATDARGGTNPMAIGLGMTISSVDQIHTPAPTTYTNNATDVAIDGGGYFILDNGGQIFYSRAGNFNFDELGNFVNMSNGFRVMGWMADEGKINTTRDYEAIDISNLKTVAPKATEQVIFGGNLDSNLPVVADPATGYSRWPHCSQQKPGCYEHLSGY
jgi:flagellar hook protein FlgE